MKNKTALKCFKRCYPKIILFLYKLKFQMNFRGTIPELIGYIQEKFVSSFYAYETDEQYLRYMFIVSKNVMRNIIKKENRYNHTHVSSSSMIASQFHMTIDNENNTPSVRILNEMAVDSKTETPLDSLIRKEVIKQIENNLDRELYRKIFSLLVEGYDPNSIAKKIGFSQGYVKLIRKNHIWPTVKEVMKLSEQKYKRLSSSGRIFS